MRRKKALLKVYAAAQSITDRRCDKFVDGFTCITEDDGEGPWKPCDPCLLAQAGVPVACDVEGHAWGQPEGVFTRRECLRCRAIPSPHIGRHSAEAAS